MHKRHLALIAVILAWTAAFAAVLCAAGAMGFGSPQLALADAPEVAPAVSEIAPVSAPNDVDTTIIITGTGFAAVPTVTLGSTHLDDVGWASAERLTATVPWGMVTGTYTLTVANPNGEAGALADAFTVTQGFDLFTTDGPYGGDLRDIYKKPGTPTTVFALVRNVGLFISENAGELWAPLYDRPDWSTGQDSFVFDAQDPDVIYLGPILDRTTDGGETWERLFVLPDIPGGRPCFLHFPVAHPSLGGVVYAGIGCWEPGLMPDEAGVFRSDDYGETWITKTEGMTDTSVWSLAIHPSVTQTMLAGTRNGNLYRSLDGGENWSLTGHFTGTVARVYFNPYAPMEAWVTSATHNAVYLLRSTDLNTWQPILSDTNGGDDGARWDLAFLPGTIWAASNQVYTSTDNGNTWNSIDWLGGNAIEATADNPLEVYAASGRGIRKSDDGGSTWRDINEGLAGQFPYLLATSPLDPDLVLVKTRQSLYRSFNGGHAWQDLNYAGGGYPRGDYLAIDPHIPTRIYLGTNTPCDDLFCLEISTDSGETWELITTTLPLTYTDWDGSGAYAITPHPSIPGRILAGNSVWDPSNPENSLGMVYASDDYGQNWTYMGPSQPISWIVDIAYDAVDPDLVYMATSGSGHWKSTDGGATWRDMPNIGTGGIDDEIAPHPRLSGHLVIAVRDQGVYGSQDAGETWTFLSSSAESPLVYAPTFPPTLYGSSIFEDRGVLVRSADNGLTWETVEGAPAPTRLATAADSERVILYIASAGGLASPAGAQATLTTNGTLGEVAILGGGVYRYTTLLGGHWVYLPLILHH